MRYNGEKTMKKRENSVKKSLICLLLCLLLLLSACKPSTPTTPDVCTAHTDADQNKLCDVCGIEVVILVDIYGVNDLHGKLADTSAQPGVDEMTTYLKNARAQADHMILLSIGDMWQGTPESNLTEGNMITEWMNDLDFDAMVLGNHEYDWGEDPIIENEALAEFPFLAINIYERATQQQVDYCQSSIMIECGGAQVGIIGAMGDCYSSIASYQVEDVYFRTGQELTTLVKREAEKLRSEGADFIVYIIHDGYGDGGSTTITDRKLSSYYDIALSDGYVDLVFEAHTHQRYVMQDSRGVYHIQGGGDNKGITYAQIEINIATGETDVVNTKMVSNGTYVHLEDDPIVEDLLDKYADEIEIATRVVGTNRKQLDGKSARQLVADLYYQVGMERWGDEYDIALGGGFISIRSPGYLAKGEVTYGMLQSIFPFDNEIVLCSISGENLKEKFFETDHYSYYISYGDYGNRIKNNIDPNGTYYVVVDTYTSTYKPNGLTEIARYDAEVYARDLLADYITAGGLE